jgi:peptidyl-tRNA hydrolase
MIEHVLGGFTAEEEKSIEAAVERAQDLLGCLLSDGVEKAMNIFNGNNNSN